MSARFTRHEYEEYVRSLVSSDTLAASSNPITRSLEAAHAIAFRSGLGSSLFAPEHLHISVDEIKAYAQRAFVKDNIAVVGMNMEAPNLNKLVDASFTGVATADEAVDTPASQYFGGETRLEAAHDGLQTVFIGFGTTDVSTSAELATLRAHLSTTPSVKWAQGLSPIVQAIPEGTNVQSVWLPYSDASLFGLIVSGRTVEGVKEAGKVAVEMLKKSTKGLNEGELKSALAKAKFGAASAMESREGLARELGAKVCSKLGCKCTADRLMFCRFSLEMCLSSRLCLRLPRSRRVLSLRYVSGLCGSELCLMLGYRRFLRSSRPSLPLSLSATL